MATPAVNAEELKAELAPPADAEAKPTPIVGDVKMNGYFRMGYGVSSEKGRMVCFQVAGALSKYRLGNECDEYGEFNFSAPMYVGRDGLVATAHFMPAVYIPTSLGHLASVSSPTNTTATGADWSFPIWYMDMKGLAFLPGGTVWLGRRYYKREDIHITDFFYWNPSGLGAGVEDIEVGAGMTLSYAAFAVDGPSTSAGAPAPPLSARTDFAFRHDLQLRGIPLNPGGEIQVGFQFINNRSDDPTTHSGWGATIRHDQKAFGGINKLAVQYGQGPGTGLGSAESLTNNSDFTRLRLVDVFSFQLSDWFGGMVAALYQHDTLPGDASQDWISAGTRLSFALAEHAKLLVDLGHDQVTPDIGDTRSLTKITIAPAIVAAQDFWSRPEVRIFFTYALWNDAARIAGVDSGDIYTNTDETSGATVGIHAETWW